MIYMFLILVLAAIVFFLYLISKTIREDNEYYKRQAEQEAKFRRNAKEKRKQDTENIHQNIDDSFEELHNSFEELHKSLEELLKSLEELRAVLEEKQRARQEYCRNSYNNNSNRGSNSSNGERTYKRLEGVYKTFDLTPSTLTEASLKQSYRRLVQLYHPDRNKEPNATEKFQKIQSYYSILQKELKSKNAR